MLFPTKSPYIPLLLRLLFGAHLDRSLLGANLIRTLLGSHVTIPAKRIRLLIAPKAVDAMLANPPAVVLAVSDGGAPVDAGVFAVLAASR